VESIGWGGNGYLDGKCHDIFFDFIERMLVTCCRKKIEQVVFFKKQKEVEVQKMMG